MSPPAVRRSLQEERSEETRTRILEATIESLVAVGYARTSTAVICERAGVSRAAWIYHYATKATLVSAAVERLLRLRQAALPKLEAGIDRGADSPSSAVDVLAESFEGPMFLAWLELVVASRTDDDLRAQMSRLSLRFSEAFNADLRRMFPAVAENPIFEHGDFALALMDGLFLTRILYGDARFRRMLATLRDVAERAQSRTTTEPAVESSRRPLAKSSRRRAGVATPPEKSRRA